MAATKSEGRNPRPERRSKAEIRRINEIWWIAVDKFGCSRWDTLQLRKKDVAELIAEHRTLSGYRIAKLHVKEVV